MIINVKVKTNSNKNEIKKMEENNFEIKTTATPENGKANKSVIEILSKYFRIGKTKIQIIKGHTNHIKIIEIEL